MHRREWVPVSLGGSEHALRGDDLHFTPQVVAILEQSFKISNHASQKEVMRLLATTDLTERRSITMYFPSRISVLIQQISSPPPPFVLVHCQLGSFP